jgi:hypothetical protein
MAAWSAKPRGKRPPPLRSTPPTLRLVSRLGFWGRHARGRRSPAGADSGRLRSPSITSDCQSSKSCGSSCTSRSGFPVHRASARAAGRLLRTPGTASSTTPTPTGSCGRFGAVGPMAAHPRRGNPARGWKSACRRGGSGAAEAQIKQNRPQAVCVAAVSGSPVPASAGLWSAPSEPVGGRTDSRDLPRPVPAAGDTLVRTFPHFHSTATPSGRSAGPWNVVPASGCTAWRVPGRPRSPRRANALRRHGLLSPCWPMGERPSAAPAGRLSRYPAGVCRMRMAPALPCTTRGRCDDHRHRAGDTGIA